MSNYKKQIIVAIDTINLKQALHISESVRGVGAVKLGLEFFCANGPQGISAISATGVKIFLDLKFHDIPNTVIGAIRAILKLKPYMITVHLSGGFNMLSESIKTVEKLCSEAKISKPMILGVSVLTSIDEDDFSSLGISGTVEEQVKRLADLAIRSRLDGLVCSAKELKMIKEYVKDDLLLVTPGIRPSGGNVNDQKRIVTPSTAIKDGADFLVIGRPITDEKNPKVALDKICSEI